jgi:two-component system, OmpR family, response regulator
MRILVVDDHLETRELVTRHLERASHGVKSVGTCGEALAALAEGPFDVVVLDVMLPDGSGVELCARLRAERLEVPILLLTARGAVRSRVEGLDAGADDYLGKPFALSELRARIMALGRRGPRLRDRTVTLGSLVVDLDARRVRVDEKTVPLTAKELSIVGFLAARRGRVVARHELIEAVWGDVTESAGASLDVLVMRIRRKLGEQGQLLQTVRGLGYTLESDP